MRLLFGCCIMIALASICLAPSSAAAQNLRTKIRYQYASCACQFGYPGRACVAQAACVTEGGRCAGSCIPPPESE
jgi:hypothetical protein